MFERKLISSVYVTLYLKIFAIRKQRYYIKKPRVYLIYFTFDLKQENKHHLVTFIFKGMKRVLFSRL